jgi:putative ABC transport system substrate-binding protein
VRRREFIGLLGGAVALWPLAGRAQQPPMPLIGYVGTRAQSTQHLKVAFRDGLAEMGFIDGQNVAIEYRWTEGSFERLPALLVGLVRRQVAVIFVPGGNMPTLVAKGVTTSIPIVFMTNADPVESGLVATLNRPGGNVTGVTLLAAALGAKRLQLLRELFPKATAVALLTNPNNPNSELDVADVQAAARSLATQVQVLQASNDQEIAQAFANIVALKVAALLVIADPLFTFRRDHVVTMAARHAVPAMYFAREFMEDGGLISYGASFASAARLCGNYAGRILKGEKPADLPVQQPTKFELVINLKTAKALGLTVPPSLLARADQVIE